MALFSFGTVSSNVTAANASLEIIANSNWGYRLLEIGFTAVGTPAAGAAMGLGKPAANGGTPTTPAAVLAEDSGDTTAGGTTSALAWGTGPSAPSTYMRRVSPGTTIGSGMIWTFPRGIKVPKGTSNTLVLFNTVTAPAAGGYNLWFVVDE